MSGLTHNVSAQTDELLDHIYEYGTNSEGVISRINSLCDAAVEQLRAELAASRHELEGAKKAANAQARLIDSLEQQRAHLHAQRDQWIEARNTLDSERAANARLTEELSASREREARMRGALRNLLALDADHQRGADDEDVCAEVSEARAALAEVAQG